MSHRAIPMGLTVLLAWLGTAALSAQTNPLAESWRWAPYTAASGLPQGRISRLVDDEDGTSWAMGNTGLAWFDDFEWHRNTGTGALPERGFSSLSPRAGGGLLVVARGRVFTGGMDGFSEVQVPGSFGVSNAVSVDRGRMMLASQQGTFLLDPSGVTPRPVPLPWSGLLGLSRTLDGRVFASHRRALFEFVDDEWVHLLDIESIYFVGVRSRGDTTYVVESSPERGRLWLLPRDGPGTFETIDLPSPLTALDVAPDGVVAVMSGYNRIALRTEVGWTEVIPTPPQVAGATVVRYTASGDFMVGGITGVDIANATRRRWRRALNDVGSTTVNAILPRPDGALWLGTSTGVRILHRDGREESIRTVLGIRLGAVTGLVEDRDGAIWASSGSGFPGALRFSDGVWSRFGPAQGLTAPRVHDIAVARDGTLWFLGLSGPASALGASNPGAFHYDGQTFTRWGAEDGLLSDRVYSFAEGDDGALWFGTLEGLSRFRDGQWRHWTTATGLVTRKVFALHMAKDGTLWLGHGNEGYGLGRISPAGELSYLDEDDGLADSRIWDIAVGDGDVLWATSYAGLTRISDGTINSFGPDEGLTVPNAWPVRPDGDVVYVGAAGAGLFELSLAETDNPAPRLHVDPVRVTDDGIRATWVAVPFQGERPQDRVPTRYRLDGGPWSAWSLEHGVTLPPMNAGVHEIEVQATSLFGTTSDPASQSFRAPNPLLRGPLAALGLSAWIITMIVGLGVYARRRRHHLRDIEERERYFRSLIENTSDLIVVVDLDHTIQYVSPSVGHILGRESSEIVGGSIHDLIAASDDGVVASLLDAALAEPDPTRQATVAWPTASGELRTIDLLVRGEVQTEGRLAVLHGRDRTEHERTEAQLRQALKMEAVGQLTGGVAHDFNNLLTVIIGELEMAADDGSRSDLSMAREAAGKAAELTSRLLSFSRQQPLTPRPIDLSSLVEDLSGLLRRTLGELVTVVVEPHPEPCICAVDVGQLEHAILNLGINARDAMPAGGALTISIDTVPLGADAIGPGITVEEGDYARLVIRDTGEGISPEELPLVFDPFFTTKGVGKGSGLGLSMVYGFVKQSRGYITIESEVGMGTVIEVYLPLVGAPAGIDDD